LSDKKAVWEWGKTGGGEGGGGRKKKVEKGGMKGKENEK